jgi:hypothetical protein
MLTLPPDFGHREFAARWNASVHAAAADADVRAVLQRLVNVRPSLRQLSAVADRVLPHAIRAGGVVTAAAMRNMLQRQLNQSKAMVCGRQPELAAAHAAAPRTPRWLWHALTACPAPSTLLTRSPGCVLGSACCGAQVNTIASLPMMDLMLLVAAYRLERKGRDEWNFEMVGRRAVPPGACSRGRASVQPPAAGCPGLPPDLHAAGHGWLGCRLPPLALPPMPFFLPCRRQAFKELLGYMSQGSHVDRYEREAVAKGYDHLLTQGLVAFVDARCVSGGRERRRPRAAACGPVRDRKLPCSPLPGNSDQEF